MENLITPEELERLDKLFDEWEREPVQTDEDLIRLGEAFGEEE